MPVRQGRFSPFLLSVRLSVLPEVSSKKCCFKEGAALRLRPQEILIWKSQSLHKPPYGTPKKLFYPTITISYNVKTDNRKNFFHLSTKKINFFSIFRKISHFSTSPKKAKRQGAFAPAMRKKIFLSHSLQAIKILPLSNASKRQIKAERQKPLPFPFFS